MPRDTLPSRTLYNCWKYAFTGAYLPSALVNQCYSCIYLPTQIKVFVSKLLWKISDDILIQLKCLNRQTYPDFEVELARWKFCLDRATRLSWTLESLLIDIFPKIFWQGLVRLSLSRYLGKYFNISRIAMKSLNVQYNFAQHM